MTDPNSARGPVTVVLVHGAFADGSSWSGVIERLQAADITVRAIVNPLRGMAADSAYVASVLSQIAGPVLAVGHSYGGAIVSNAATNAGNVVGLVYVAAFAPDEGEKLGEIENGSTNSVLNAAIRPSNHPIGSGPETAVELSIDPASFHDVFASDVPERTPLSCAPPSGPWWPAPSANPTARRRGRSFPAGRRSRPAIRQPAPISCVPRPSAPRPRSPRLRDHT
jgi:pimeloyl-ACP methyl ester carboxylesterase